MDAKEARRIGETNEISEANIQYKNILKMILEDVKSSSPSYSIRVNTLSTLNKRKLEDLGYGVKINKSYDQRQGEYNDGYIISW